MTLPGSTITKDDTEQAVGGDLALARQFVVVELERGSDAPTRIKSTRDLTAKFGERTLDSQAGFDWLTAYFADGGAEAYVIPLRGPAARQAEVQVPAAGNTTSFTVKRTENGADGNRYAIDIDAGVTTGTFVAKFLRDGVVKITSPELPDAIALQAFVASSAGKGLFVVLPGAGPDPTPTNQPLAFGLGDDDFDGVTTDAIADCLTRFNKRLGAGVAVLPGRTALTAHLALADHVASPGINRIARVQMPDITDVEALVEHGQALRDHEASDVIDQIYGRETITGLTPSTTRSVDGTAIRSGREAANDAQGISPNQPAAGDFGQSTIALGLSHEFDADEDRIALTAAGINLLATIDGNVQVFGSRTAVDPDVNPAGFRLGSARLRMAVIELVDYQLRRANFLAFDSKGVKLGVLRGKVESTIKRYQESLYKLGVTAAIVPGDDPGSKVVEVDVELQITEDAEVIRATIRRTTQEG